MTSQECTLLLFACINTIFCVIAFFNYWRYRVEKNKRNPEYLPVGTIVLVKISNGKIEGSIRIAVSNSNYNGLGVHQDITETLAKDFYVTSIEYITPPKP